MIVDQLCGQNHDPTLRRLVSEAFSAGRGSLASTVAKQVAEIERLREQLLEQTKSLCTHCGQFFPAGKEGLAEFRKHISTCNAHPLSGMAAEIERLRSQHRHCDHCGGTWLDDGINSGCYCREIERLRAIVDRLPKCWRLNESGELVQDVPVVPEQQVWHRDWRGTVSETCGEWESPFPNLLRCCYDTPAAAEAARTEVKE